jgi:hypothetical protein
LLPSGGKQSNSGLKQKALRDAPASTRLATANNALSKKFNFEFGDISEEKDEEYKEVKIQDDEDALSVDINMDDITV